MDKENKFFICACHSIEHQTYFWKDKELGFEELYIEMHLITYRNFFKRLWIGLKYAFGYKSIYGNWDTFIFTKEDEKKLRDYLNANML
jgi:hypothetical protein